MRHLRHLIFATIAALVFVTPASPVSAQSASDFVSRLAHAKHRFLTEKEYAASAAAFRQLWAEATTSQYRAEAFDHLNASLYALGHHDAAVDAICEHNRREPAPPERWIFDIHAHARKMALNSGYERSIAAMLRYRKQCAIAAFSPFWVAIPLAKMEYLKRGIHVLAENYIHPEKDRIVLRQLLDRFPADPYIEYAHYFLHQFSNVKKAELIGLSRTVAGPFPAIDTWDSDPYLKAKIPHVPDAERPILLASLDQKKCDTPAACATLAKWLPRSVHSRNLIVKSLTSAMRPAALTTIRPVEMEDYGRVFFAYTQNTNDPGLRDMSKELRYFLDRLRSSPLADRDAFLSIYAARNCYDSPHCVTFLRSFPDSTHARAIAIEHLRRTVARDGIAGAKAFIAAIPGQILDLESRARNQALTNLEIHLRTVLELLEANKHQQLLDYAIRIRGRIRDVDAQDKTPRFPHLAASVFSFLMTSSPGTPLSEKAHWLRQGVSPRVEYNSEDRIRIKLLEDFIENYPRSKLIDDAYAELGLQLVRGGSQADRARGLQLLERVATDYPRMNAADNALYHLANDAIDNGRYLAAARYFARVIASAAGTRFRPNAREEIPVLIDAAEALRQRKTLDAIAVSGHGTLSKADPAKVISTEPLQPGDQLKAIAGRPFRYDRSFYAQLSQHAIGATVDLLFERTLSTWNDQKKAYDTREIKARARVALATVFDVAFVAHDDPLRVRQAPDAAAPEIAALLAGATCIRYAGEQSTKGKGSALWLKITHSDERGRSASGWVNAAFLRRSTTCLD